MSNYNTIKTETKVQIYVDDNDIKSIKSEDKLSPKPFITKMGFNMSEASLDEKMNYLQKNNFISDNFLFGEDIELD